MAFTEHDKEKAQMLEKVTACGLARYFAEQVETYMDRAIGIETAEDMIKSFEDIQQTKKNVKLLEDVGNGKYRLLFMALAAETERAVNEIIEREGHEDENG